MTIIWAGYVARIVELRNYFTISVGKSEGLNNQSVDERFILKWMYKKTRVRVLTESI
jgi:hypothetical protein